MILTKSAHVRDELTVYRACIQLSGLIGHHAVPKGGLWLGDPYTSAVEVMPPSRTTSIQVKNAR